MVSTPEVAERVIETGPQAATSEVTGAATELIIALTGTRELGQFTPADA